MQSILTNSNSLYIHHHLGLGDHIICNGLVRYVHKTLSPENTWLVVKNKNLNNVKHLYRDEPKIKFIPVEEDSNFYDMPFNWSELRLLRVGFEKCREEDFDVSFYDTSGVSFLERWNSWYYERNHSREQKLIEELVLPSKFALVHDTSSVGKFDLNIETNLPIIKVSRLKSEITMFDWIGVIERATEIHCVDSSFIHLVNSIQNTTDLLYYHMAKKNKMQIRFLKGWLPINY
jgi:hypothetical protein